MTISIVVPQLGESVAEGTVSKWLKQVGDRVRKEEPLVEIQTDKINVEIPSPAEGVLQAITVPEGTTVLVGTEIAVLAGVGEAAGAGPEPAAKAAVAAASPSRSAATEAAQAPRPARSQEQVMPTRARAAAAAPAPSRAGEPGPRPGFLPATAAPGSPGPREEVIPFTKVRKLIADNMVKSKFTAPHVTTFDEVDMTAVVATRKEWGPKL